MWYFVYPKDLRLTDGCPIEADSSEEAVETFSGQNDEEVTEYVVFKMVSPRTYEVLAITNKEVRET